MFILLKEKISKGKSLSQHKANLKTQLDGVQIQFKHKKLSHNPGEPKSHQAISIKDGKIKYIFII